MSKSDEEWVKYGKSDPYFGVLSDERFRQSRLTDSSRAEFFGSGERHVSAVFGAIQEFFYPVFAPRSALDFGCGVGRISIPLARRVDKVFAADVSAPMLLEAARNGAQQEISNITYIKSDDGLGGFPTGLDFIHSFIVFQHIPIGRGLAILGRMLDLLAEDGIGALHFTFARHAPRFRIYLQRLSEYLPLSRNFYNLAIGKRFSDPTMEMNCYDFNAILDILCLHGCHDIHLRFSDHDGFIGAMIYFRKRRIAPL